MLVRGLRIVIVGAVLMGSFVGARAAHAAPVNDRFADAIEVDRFPYRNGGSTTGATTETDEPASAFPCLSPGGTVWYRFTTDVPLYVAARAHIDGRPGINPSLEVFEGTTLGSLRPVACVTKASVYPSFAALPGSTYYLRIGRSLDFDLRMGIGAARSREEVGDGHLYADDVGASIGAASPAADREIVRVNDVSVRGTSVSASTFALRGDEEARAGITTSQEIGPDPAAESRASWDDGVEVQAMTTGALASTEASWDATDESVALSGGVLGTTLLSSHSVNAGISSDDSSHRASACVNSTIGIYLGILPYAQDRLCAGGTVETEPEPLLTAGVSYAGCRGGGIYIPIHVCAGPGASATVGPAAVVVCVRPFFVPVCTEVSVP